jgi:hypothetical protein
MTGSALAAATPDTVRAPVEARGRILAAVAAQGVPRGAAAAVPALAGAAAQGGGVSALPGQPVPAVAPTHAGRLAELRTRRQGRETLPIREEPKPRGFSFRWMALAAAALVLVFVTGAVLSGPLGLTNQNTNESDVGDAVTTASRILADPNHLEATLKDANGQQGGTALLSGTSQDLVIVSQALTPASGTTYDCFVVTGGAPTWIGRMHFYGNTSYWEGTLAPGTADSGDQVQIRAGGADGPVALSGTF